IIVTPVDGRIPSHEVDRSWMHGMPNKEDESMVQLYKVKTQVNPTVPFAGSAAEPKLLTLTALPSFVRSIAIHAAILSNVHATFLNSVGVNNEFISPWRARLQSIKRMRGIAERDAEKITPEVYSDDIPAPASESTDFSKATAAQVLDLLTKELEEFRS
ncbi:Tuberous sclerosis 2-like protein, partial [Linderina pennispora]